MYNLYFKVFLGLSLGLMLHACQPQNSSQNSSTQETTHEPAVERGTLRSYEFKDSILGSRRADVWIPEGLKEGDSVAWIWMHDGQMLYDSTVTWNKQEWLVDETLQQLIDEDRSVPTVVIGLYNSEHRRRELFPQKPLESAFPRDVEQILGGEALADDYLRFATNRVIPEVLAALPYQMKERGWVAGSSMGGLMSAYALCEYPQLFKGALCLSTHWPGVNPNDYPKIPEMFISYFAAHLPADSEHAIYFDTGDETLDSYYPPHHQAMEAALKARAEKGSALRYTFEFFPGADHSENSWNKRLHIPLEWALAE